MDLVLRPIDIISMVALPSSNIAFFFSIWTSDEALGVFSGDQYLKILAIFKIKFCSERMVLVLAFYVFFSISRTLRILLRSMVTLVSRALLRFFFIRLMRW